AAGFRTPEEVGDYDPDHGSPTSGTEDLLLFMDVVETVVGAAYRGGDLLGSAGELAGRLRPAPWKTGRQLFTPRGNRRTGTGEHVVYLRPPALKNDRVAPRAELEVWSRAPGDRPGAERAWALARYLTVSYEGGAGEGGPPYGPN